MFHLALSQTSQDIVLPNVCLTGPEGFVFVNMILDTGAADCIISRNAASALGYDFANSSFVSILTAIGTARAPVVNIEGISLGNITTHDVGAICHDLPGIEGVDGLIGLSFLKRVRTLIDFRALRLEIS